ncbi:hypothetical protein TI39_contig395g00011 [Zymoseptoria brevis]|uniref:Uncharacterized protein n=1 Tax=Zymoseptoria brevis TaxID=1047168 RepID=A0A0F4GNU2_9PEZI|nr:hypothetical protein TI39_contig395g00011 [Zymoseptoria brevis]
MSTRKFRSSPPSTPQSAPMLEKWSELPGELSQMIIIASTPTHLKVRLFRNVADRECIQAVDEDDWKHLKSILHVDSNSRKAVLKLLRTHGELESMSTWRKGAPCEDGMHIARGLFDHFGSIVFATCVPTWPPVGPALGIMPFDVDFDTDQIKIAIDLPGPGQNRRLSLMEITSTDPMPLDGDGVPLGYMMKAWLEQMPRVMWAFHPTVIWASGHLGPSGMVFWGNWPEQIRWVQI